MTSELTLFYALPTVMIIKYIHNRHKDIQGNSKLAKQVYHYHHHHTESHFYN
jgi:hypothetical protein